MTKHAISVTLDVENLRWLKGRTVASGTRSVSELLDQLVTAARSSNRTGPARSVVGTIDIAALDPGLETADEAVRSLYSQSIDRPLRLHEAGATYGRPKSRPKRRG